MSEYQRRSTDADKKEIMDSVILAMNTAIERHQLTCPIREIVPQVVLNTKGVNNFNEFRLDTTKKMAFVHGAVKAWSVILGVLLGTIVGLGVWTFHEVYPAFRQIMAEYYSHHPEARVQQKSLSVPPDGFYTVYMEPHQQDARKQRTSW